MKHIPLIAGLTVCTILALGSLATAISIAGHDSELKTVRTSLVDEPSELTATGIGAFTERGSASDNPAAWTPLLLCTIAAAGAAAFLRRATA